MPRMKYVEFEKRNQFTICTYMSACSDYIQEGGWETSGLGILNCHAYTYTYNHTALYLLLEFGVQQIGGLGGGATPWLPSSDTKILISD